MGALSNACVSGDLLAPYLTHQRVCRSPRRAMEAQFLLCPETVDQHTADEADARTDDPGHVRTFPRRHVISSSAERRSILSRGDAIMMERKYGIVREGRPCLASVWLDQLAAPPSPPSTTCPSNARMDGFFSPRSDRLGITIKRAIRVCNSHRARVSRQRLSLLES